MKKEQKIIAVCGRKNSGKTSLLVKIIEKLAETNRKAAVIKHDGHDFECDIPETDSYKLKKAGAYGTAVYSKNRIFIHKDREAERADELIKLFPEAEIIFIEGLKTSSYPKIEVVRKGISDSPISNPEGRFLIVTDHEEEKFKEKSLKFEAIDEIIACIDQIKLKN